MVAERRRSSLTEAFHEAHVGPLCRSESLSHCCIPREIARVNKAWSFRQNASSSRAAEGLIWDLQNSFMRAFNRFRDAEAAATIMETSKASRAEQRSSAETTVSRYSAGCLQRQATKGDRVLRAHPWRGSKHLETVELEVNSSQPLNALSQHLEPYKKPNYKSFYSPLKPGLCCGWVWGS